jgi:hypothetical protein
MGENSPNLVNLRQMLRGETRTKKTDEKKICGLDCDLASTSVFFDS